MWIPVTIGLQQMKDYEAGWSEHFHSSLKKNVITMQETKKSITVGDTSVYDTKLIFNRVMGLQQSRDLNIKDVLSYELSPVPASLFDEHGIMRMQAKAALKTKHLVVLWTCLGC